MSELPDPAKLPEADFLRECIALAIEASEDGSAGDAIQAMLLLLRHAMDPDVDDG